MADVVIENPILNSPFCEPTRHFKFTDEGISNEIAEGRRISSYFIPIGVDPTVTLVANSSWSPGIGDYPFTGDPHLTQTPAYRTMP